ncbi:MAG: hypothetical protein ACR2MG_19165, partial [Pyrinomonadaceae bacterium]
MSTAVLEDVLAKVKQLSAEEKAKVREVLDKTAPEIEKTQNGDFQTDEDALEKERQRRIELSGKIMGKYEHLLTSSEDFARRKQEEIEREDKGGMPKE